MFFVEGDVLSNFALSNEPPNARPTRFVHLLADLQMLLRKAQDIRLRRGGRGINANLLVIREREGSKFPLPGDEFTARMFAALNAMMLDMLAAVARKDYDDRRRRQAQGVAKAKAAGAYRGRPEDTDRNAGIAALLCSGLSWTAIQPATGCSRATIAKVAKRAA
jgi:hypothetical protein